MRTTFKILLTLVMVMGLIGTAQATTNILYFNDYNVGTDRMAQALAGLGAGYSVTTVSSSGDFATDIASGTYNLGILMVQNWWSTTYDSAITALGTFVAGGGRSIYTDWSMNNSYASLFGASWTGNRNQTSFTVTGPLATGITNPVSLYNPGWGIFSMGVSGASVPATFPNSEGAIVIGNGGRSITNGFLTDTFSDGPTGVQLYTNEITFVPLPGAVWLLGSGLLGLAGLRRFRKR
jgi:hypothetical protein